VTAGNLACLIPLGGCPGREAAAKSAGPLTAEVARISTSRRSSVAAGRRVGRIFLRYRRRCLPHPLPRLFSATSRRSRPAGPAATSAAVSPSWASRNPLTLGRSGRRRAPTGTCHQHARRRFPSGLGRAGLTDIARSPCRLGCSTVPIVSLRTRWAGGHGHIMGQFLASASSPPGVPHQDADLQGKNTSFLFVICT
jgi:hypothetical protein